MTPEVAAGARAPKASGENAMRALRLVKVVVNIGVGESGDRRTKAEKVLEMVTHQKPVATRSHATNRDLGIRQGQEIGAKVTLRGDVAEEFFRRALGTREGQLDPDSVDQVGNVAFGIPDYTDFPGLKYDPQIGIFGMDVCAEIGRAGLRVRRRSRSPRPVGRHQRPTPDETRAFLASTYGVRYLE